jgi:putative transposase
VKRSILVEAGGGPLSVVVAEANVHDAKLLAATLEAVVVEQVKPTDKAPQYLCLDKGYDNPTGEETVARHGYTPHRWVVERTLAWLSKCRALLVRYDKKARDYLGMLKLACILLWYRRQHRLSLLR